MLMRVIFVQPKLNDDVQAVKARMSGVLCRQEDKINNKKTGSD